MALFKGGMPYEIDVKRLEADFPVNELPEGRKIEHQQIEIAIDCTKGTSRYYGVVDSWMNKIKHSHGIVLRWEPSQGVVVMTPSQVLDHTETRLRQKIRQTGRVMREFVWVDRNRLDNIGQKRLDHQTRIANVLKEHLNMAKKELAIELGPVKSLPKPKLTIEQTA